MKKTTNNSKKDEKRKVSRPYKYFDEYEPLFSRQKVPVSFAYIDRLIEEMGKHLDYLVNELRTGNKDKCSFTAEEFYIKMRIPHKTIEYWRLKLDYLNDAHKNFVKAIGELREAGAIHSILREKMIMHVMAHYSKIYDDADKRRGALGLADEAISVVEIPTYPEEQS
jgi:hypothetical protein